MSGTGDAEHMPRFPKLSKSDEYIGWSRRVRAILRRNDTELLGLTAEPATNSPTVRKKWFETMSKAKSTIILCLGDSPLSRTRRLVDNDNAAAKELWDELADIYATSNAQAILNIRTELDNLRFSDDGDWDEHVNCFTAILGKLATYEAEIPDEEKASKLIRTLPN